MGRVEDLQKKYPDLAREFIVKWDVVNHGVQDSDDLLKGGIWIRSIANFTRDHKLTLQQSVKDKPERVRPGWVRFPSSFYMRNGFGASCKRDASSPYRIEDLGDGQFGLYEGEEKVEDVWFPGAAVGEPGDKDFWPGNMFSGANRNCGLGTGANVPEYFQAQACGYFATGDQCKFCNYNANHEDAAAVGLRPSKSTIDEIVEHHRQRASKMKVIEITFPIGGAPGLKGDQNQRIEFFTQWIARMASATPYHIELIASLMPISRKQLQRLKDVGATVYRNNMETTDRELFSWLVPGKAKQFGYDGYIEGYQNAVDIFGVGQVSAGLVSGFTLMGEKGHKTWQEARDSFVEGDRLLIKNGVVPVWTSFRPVPGSVFGDDPSTLAKMPPTELYLEIAQGDHAAMKEYGLYEKMTKFPLCPFDCLTHYYLGDLGMIELARTPGNWMADRVPYEINWLAKFIDNVKVGAPVTPSAGPE